MSKGIELSASLQNIADNKYLSELDKGADYVLRAKDRERDMYTNMSRGASLARIAGNRRIFLVVGNEAEGETWFFFFGKTVTEVARKLKAMQDN